MSLVQFSSLLVAVDQINTGPPESPLSVEVTLPEHELPQTQSQPSQPPQYENLNEESHPVPIYYVACGKCQHVIPRVSPEAGRVKCSVCQEDTPVRPPPDGHRYVRCECGSLIVCSTSEPTVECHRRTCMSTFVLSELNEGRTIQCDDCLGTFHLRVDNDAPITKCRRCRFRSTLWVKKRIKICSIVASCFIVLGIFATIATVFIQQIVDLSDKDSFYVNITYLFACVAVFAGICLFVRTTYYCAKIQNRITPDSRA